MRKKSILTALLALVLVIAPSGTGDVKQAVFAQNGIQVMLHGKLLALPTPPALEQGTTLVPLRSIAEALDAKVQYHKDNQGQQVITLTQGTNSASLTIGSSVMSANGRSIQLSVAPRLQGEVTLVPLRAISESLGAVVAWDSVNRIVRIDAPAELPLVGSAANLKKLLAELDQYNRSMNKTMFGTAVEERAVAAMDGAEAPQAQAADSSASGSGDYSTTNVQVEGVDEADWAKTDGSFIYQLSGSRLYITDIRNQASPKLVAEIDYTADKDTRFYPNELYVDAGQLIVIGQHSAAVDLPMPMPMPEENSEPQQNSSSSGGGTSSSSGASSSGFVGAAEQPDIAPAADARIGIYPYVPMTNTVKTMIYNITADGQPTLIRETELEGGYISSRKVGSALYLVTNKYSYMPYSTDSAAAYEPLYRDSAVSDKIATLPVSDIRYFPQSPDSSMMLVGALDLDRPEQEMQVNAYLGSGQTIYASTKHLYVAIGKYVEKGKTFEQQTIVHKFRLDHGRVTYIGEGSVPGSVLNQFSMDEHEGFFRIATTVGNMWGTGEETSRNNLYVLDEQLSMIGKLENLAPGERIYSARFMGGRAYMVTFRNVDPLFVIDLNNPANPTVLGELKIPGYSDYLHPYDENHLIGFGMDTIEVPSNGWGPDETVALTQGMKLALFDVTDVSQPKEKFKEIIGDRGTHSELLYDHKALLFSREKNLLSFPVQVMEIKEQAAGGAGDRISGYGEMTFQGAYVYNLDAEQGFTLRGRISHLTEQDLSSNGYYDYGKTIRRILYAGNTLYTLSERMLKANALDSLSEQGKLDYPLPPEENYYKYPGVVDILPSLPAQ